MCSIYFVYKIELKLILLDADEDDDDELDNIVCSSRCVFLCSFK